MRSPTEGELLENVSTKNRHSALSPPPAACTLVPLKSMVDDYFFGIIFALSPAVNVPLCSYVNLSVFFIV